MCKARFVINKEYLPKSKNFNEKQDRLSVGDSIYFV